MGHIDIQHQSTEMEHQQPDSLPTEPVTVMDLQAGGGNNSKNCHLPTQSLQPQEGCLFCLGLARVEEGRFTM